jgi:hypothetical protein
MCSSTDSPQNPPLTSLQHPRQPSRAARSGNMVGSQSDASMQQQLSQQKSRQTAAAAAMHRAGRVAPRIAPRLHTPQHPISRPAPPAPACRKHCMPPLTVEVQPRCDADDLLDSARGSSYPGGRPGDITPSSEDDACSACSPRRITHAAAPHAADASARPRHAARHSSPAGASTAAHARVARTQICSSISTTQ